jgi:twitching motility protein PilT
VQEILRQAVERNASDVQISANVPPVFRIDGQLHMQGEPLTPAQTDQWARSLMTEEQWERYCQMGDVDFSYSLPGISRFRVNVYRQRGYTSIAVRLIPDQVPTLRELNLPSILETLTEYSRGLVLVTGPTGSGKSTTLAALIDRINTTQRRHIITLEDPIEYLHSHRLSVIEQREVGHDTPNFAHGLRAALRQDPDVILIGEMRDLETMQTAIMAAETGHLVFATMHTGDSVQTVERIIDVFPAAQQGQIRLQLASVLKAVVAQRLFRIRGGHSRIAAVEVLVNTPAVANLIRSDQTHQIRSALQTGRAYGMQTMEMHIRQLLQEGKLEPGDEALKEFMGA